MEAILFAVPSDYGQIHEISSSAFFRVLGLITAGTPTAIVLSDPPAITAVSGVVRKDGFIFRTVFLNDEGRFQSSDRS
jgi:cation transport ATPase